MDEASGEPDVGDQLALTAESITLRPFRLEDVAAYVDQQDHLLAAGFGWERPIDEVSMRAVAERWVRQWNGPRDERNFAILERSSGVLVGDCELELRTDGFVHVMYGIFRPWRGKGYASRAVGLLLGYRSLVWPSTPVLFRIHADNEPSIAIARGAGAIPDGAEASSQGRELRRWVLT